MTEPKPEPGSQEPKMLTQEEVNAIVGRARQEERSKYSDYDGLKKDSEELRQMKVAQMTETERLTGQLADEQRNRILAEQRLTDVQIHSAITASAYNLGIVDPDAAAKLIDRTGIRVDPEKGIQGVNEALTQLVEAKPYLKGVFKAPNLNPGNNNPAPPALVLTTEQKEAARAMGVSEEQYAKALK